MSSPSCLLLRLARPQAVENKPGIFVVGGFFERAAHLPQGKLPYPYTFVLSHSEEKGVRITRHFGSNDGMAMGQKSFNDPESRDSQRRMLLSRLHEVVMPFGDERAVKSHTGETDPQKQLLRPSSLSNLSREELLHIQEGLSAQDSGGNIPRQIIEAVSGALREKSVVQEVAPLAEGLRVAAAGR